MGRQLVLAQERMRSAQHVLLGAGRGGGGQRQGEGQEQREWKLQRGRHSLGAVEDMEENRRRTGPARASARCVLAALTLVTFLAGGCAGRYAGPRTLAGIGTLGVIGGGASWSAGEG